jgi:hypothetical protein
MEMDRDRDRDSAEHRGAGGPHRQLTSTPSFRTTPLVALLPAALLRLALARSSGSTCLSSARSLACDAPCS